MYLNVLTDEKFFESLVREFHRLRKELNEFVAAVDRDPVYSLKHAARYYNIAAQLTVASSLGWMNLGVSDSIVEARRELIRRARRTTMWSCPIQQFMSDCEMEAYADVVVGYDNYMARVEREGGSK